MSAALASRAVEVFRCDLCQATFPSQAQYQQHVAGPVHRKAVEKQTQEALAAQRRAPYQAMMESALGAASWGSGHDAGRPHPTQRPGAPPPAPAAGGPGGGGGGGGGRGGGRGGRDAGRGAGRGRGPQADGAPAGPRTDVLSHEDLVKAATKTDEPLTIDGWAPPIITLPPPTAAGEPVKPSTDGPRSGGAAQQEPAAGEGSGAQGGGDGGEGDASGEGEGAGLLGLAYGSEEEEEEDAEAGQQAGTAAAKDGGRAAGGAGSDGTGSSSDDDEGGGGFTGSFF
ncbi:hypothetical protein HYH03_003725 [Edaphochlamys debaryana]|uniref:C2H2-type domain-containing protein n=1 Tax=Edaphochlamys debaryana TaxID=47281 RepID=A0A835YBJ2_9CHLO|nr:hypothetical protein HYH03_003725 [Edaphochlamys debaryana]|eukprot:KAG2498472.1 hypothetical protein HYH03_003725 [Edaphochlamys debaryana]